MQLALLGYGYWGRKLLPLLLKRAEEVFVVDPKLRVDLKTDPVLSQAVPQKLDQILKNPAVTHCFIATPEETHFSLVRDCLLAGKHVFVEKPLCLTAAQATELVTVAQNKKRVLFVDYTFLYDPAVAAITSLLKQNMIGQVQKIESLRLSAGISKPNILVTDDLVPHDLYLLRLFINSKIKTPKAKLMTLATTQVVAIDYNTKPAFEGFYTWHAQKPYRELQIQGAKGTLIWKRGESSDGSDSLELFPRSNSQRTHKPQQKIDLPKNKSSLDASITDFFSRTKTNAAIKAGEAWYSTYVNDISSLESIRNQLLESIHESSAHQFKSANGSAQT